MGTALAYGIVAGKRGSCVPPGDERTSELTEAGTNRIRSPKVGAAVALCVTLALVALGVTSVIRQATYRRAEIGFSVVSAGGELQVEPGGAAAAAGLRSGDRLRSLDGRPFGSPFAWNRALIESPRVGPIAVTVDRAGEELTAPGPGPGRARDRTLVLLPRARRVLLPGDGDHRGPPPLPQPARLAVLRLLGLDLRAPGAIRHSRPRPARLGSVLGRQAGEAGLRAALPAPRLRAREGG